MRNKGFQLLAVLMVLAISASACGSDSSDVVAGSNDSVEQDSDTGDTKSSDSDSDSGGASSSPDAGDSDTDDSSSESSGADDDASDIVEPSGEVDCSEISSAIDTAGGLVGGDPSFFAENSPEQQFEVARQTLAVLKTQVPEIADDVDAMSEGLEAIAAAYAEIGWDTDFESDPAAAVKLAQTAFSNPAVSAMIASAANIGLWMATNCL